MWLWPNRYACSCHCSIFHCCLENVRNEIVVALHARDVRNSLHADFNTVMDCDCHQPIQSHLDRKYWYYLHRNQLYDPFKGHYKFCRRFLAYRERSSLITRAYSAIYGRQRLWKGTGRPRNQNSRAPNGNEKGRATRGTGDEGRKRIYVAFTATLLGTRSCIAIKGPSITDASMKTCTCNPSPATSTKFLVLLLVLLLSMRLQNLLALLLY